MALLYFNCIFSDNHLQNNTYLHLDQQKATAVQVFGNQALMVFYIVLGEKSTISFLLARWIMAVVEYSKRLLHST